MKIWLIVILMAIINVMCMNMWINMINNINNINV